MLQALSAECGDWHKRQYRFVLCVPLTCPFECGFPLQHGAGPGVPGLLALGVARERRLLSGGGEHSALPSSIVSPYAHGFEGEQFLPPCCQVECTPRYVLRYDVHGVSRTLRNGSTVAAPS